MIQERRTAFYHRKWLTYVLMAGLLVCGQAQAQAQKPAPGPAPAPQQKRPAGTSSPQIMITPALRATLASAFLHGYVDLHTHPLANLGFGGKLIHGGMDVGSLLTADARCQHNVRATSMEHALGTDNGTHGGYGAFDNGCGDDIRKQVIRALQEANHAAVTPDWARGANDFRDWPKWTDITHQKMWVDWMRRAHDNGLSVIVALAVNNATLAAAVSGPGDGPTDDKASADLQIAETKAFIGRHSDFMEIAYNSNDLARINRAGKLAVILGVEIDNIGNFHKAAGLNEAMVRAEVGRLYSQGVRYIFPIHVVDNPFGGTAAYIGSFNLSNYHQTGRFWDLECSAPADGINYRYAPDGFDFAVAAVKAIKLGIDIARNPPTPPACPAGTGHQNRQGLTALGQVAVREMMRAGMIVDIDHMSQKAANQALAIAESVPGGGYPVTSGHNSLRVAPGVNRNENTRTVEQLKRIGRLHGMIGLGTAERRARDTSAEYAAMKLLGAADIGFALGTDINGMVKGMPPGRITYDASFPKSRTGDKEWDYNVDGVAHYGMLAEYIRDMKDDGPVGAELVDQKLMGGAEWFFQMWKKCETQRGNVR